jgi:hypothetical protein
MKKRSRKKVFIAILVPLVFIGIIAIDQYQSRDVWYACEAMAGSDMTWRVAVEKLRRAAWPRPVRCDETGCSWRTILGRWGCCLQEDDGKAGTHCSG